MQQRAELRAMLKKGRLETLSATGSETWVDPHNATLHTLAAGSSSSGNGLENRRRRLAHFVPPDIF